ncbi:MAG: hypothetical protein SO542_02715 [Muribaculaceae bacterium]|nr:hypothetical protein [Muribaculaceae bacterium]MDY5387447.1 hypothetical protein [Muribaculaceae bacterium]
MRKIIYVIAISLIGLVVESCQEKRPDEGRENATQLYNRSVSLTRQYIDSLRGAKDSAAVNGLSERYEEALTHLQFEYPAATYLEIEEGKNDTLTRLTLRYAELRDSLLRRMSSIEKSDTVTKSDSVNSSNK